MTLPILSGPRLDPRSGGRAKQLVILLHGYGSNGADLISLAPHWQPFLPDALFLAPNAPERCPGVPGGFQWWALSSLSLPAMVAGVAQAAPILDAYIDQQLERQGLTEADLLLAGFSQGTMIALHVGPRRAHRVAGIIGYSGMVIDPAGLAQEGRSKPPVLLIHGSADSIVPVTALHDAAKALRAQEFDVSTHISPGLDHGIDPIGLRLGGEFAARVLLPGVARANR